jgi:ribosome-associated protein
MARRSKTKRGSREDQAQAGLAEDAQSPSKTALKQQAHELQQLGRALSELPPERRRLAPMPEDLREAIETYLRIRSNEARRRQMQFIGKVLRGIDPAPLQAAVDAFAQGKAADAESLHRIERWRDRLIADDSALTDWMETYPDCDVQHLRSLIRAARKEHAAQDPSQRQPRSYRELFRLIRRQLAEAE